MAYIEDKKTILTKNINENLPGASVYFDVYQEYAFSKLLGRDVNYDSFEDMLNSEGVQNLVPFVDNFNDALKIYNSFPGSQKVQSSGCCAIGVKRFGP